jgi:hypothetical protein
MYHCVYASLYVRVLARGSRLVFETNFGRFAVLLTAGLEPAQSLAKTLEDGHPHVFIEVVVFEQRRHRDTGMVDPSWSMDGKGVDAYVVSRCFFLQTPVYTILVNALS